MGRYPAYPKFSSDKPLTAGGQTIYPTRETRQFLTAEASRRLARLGVRTPTRVTEEVFAPPQPQPKKTLTAPHVTKKGAPHKATRTPTHRKPTKAARATATPPQPREQAAAPPPPPPASAAATTPHTPPA